MRSWWAQRRVDRPMAGLDRSEGGDVLPEGKRRRERELRRADRSLRAARCVEQLVLGLVQRGLPVGSSVRVASVKIMAMVMIGRCRLRHVLEMLHCMHQAALLEAERRLAHDENAEEHEAKKATQTRSHASEAAGR